MIFNIWFLLIGIFAAILYISPLIDTKLNIGNIFGFLVAFVFILAGFLWNIIKNWLVFKIAGIIFVFGLICFFAILFYIILKSKHTAKDEKTVIVLGCRVFGTRPSLSLINRCKSASDYLKQNENAAAILSGGQGDDEDISEAEAMKRLMLEFGIDESRLFIEDKSKTTDENFSFSLKIIEQNNLTKDIAIATSEYHIARSLLIAKRFGIEASAIPSKTLNRVKASFFTREVFGLVYEALKKLLK